jgi:hypothetical protein
MRVMPNRKYPQRRRRRARAVKHVPHHSGHRETLVTPIQDEPPQLDRISPYDEVHLANYIRLLDAEAEGADWREAVAVIFGLDPNKEPDRAKRVHDSHLARAHWIRNTGYQFLFEPRMQ